MIKTLHEKSLKPICLRWFHSSLLHHFSQAPSYITGLCVVVPYMSEAHSCLMCLCTVLAFVLHVLLTRLIYAPNVVHLYVKRLILQLIKKFTISRRLLTALQIALLCYLDKKTAMKRLFGQFFKENLKTWNQSNVSVWVWVCVCVCVCVYVCVCECVCMCVCVFHLFNNEITVSNTKRSTKC